jgi:hypothetical protein
MVIDKKLRARIKAIASGELDEEAASPVVADDAPETHTTSTTHDESAAGADASAGADSGSAVEATAPGEPVSRSTTE